MLDWQENNCHEAWSLQLIKEIKIVANKLIQNVNFVNKNYDTIMIGNLRTLIGPLAWF